MFMFSAKKQGHAAALTIDLPEFLGSQLIIIFSFPHSILLLMQLGALAITRILQGLRTIKVIN